MFLGVPLTVTSPEALALPFWTAASLLLSPVCGTGASGNELTLSPEGGCRLAVSTVCPLVEAQWRSIKAAESKASKLKRWKRISFASSNVHVQEIGDSRIRIQFTGDSIGRPDAGPS